MVLYLVQHGQAEEEKGKVYGQKDIPLAEDGKKQILALAKTWKGKPPVRIISSDLQRAAISAEVLRETFGFKDATQVPVEKLSLLREINFGKWDGRSWDDISKEEPGKVLAWTKDWLNKKPPGGEKFKDVIARVKPWIEELTPVIKTHEPVVVVTHPAVIRALVCICIGLPFEKAFALRVDHGHLYALDYGVTGFELKYGNCGSFA